MIRFAYRENHADGDAIKKFRAIAVAAGGLDDETIPRSPSSHHSSDETKSADLVGSRRRSKISQRTRLPHHLRTPPGVLDTGEDVRAAFEEMRCDLLKLRSLLPVNSFHAKGLFKRIERNLSALCYAERRKEALAYSRVLANTPLEKDVVEHASIDGGLYDEEHS